MLQGVGDWIKETKSGYDEMIWNNGAKYEG